MKPFLFLIGVILTLDVRPASAPAALPPPSVNAGVYQCPMHPWIRSAKHAKCTICGMDLVLASTAGATAPAGVVALSPHIVTTIGVETAVVAPRALLRTVRVNGAIDDDDTQHRLISAWAEGRVEKLHVTSVGTSVTTGQPLLDLYSPELQAAQRDFLQLVRAGEIAAAALPPARERLRRMALSDLHIDDLIRNGIPTLVTTILAPAGGIVLEKSVYEGQWLKTGDKLFALGDFSRMWFQFEAYEQDMAWLRVGQSVEITTRALPGEIIVAPIAFIDPNFNEVTRTTKVRVVLANPHFNTTSGEAHRLFHRVLAEARVLVESPQVLTAPRSAILDAGMGPIAYVDLGAGHYEQRKLRLGRRGDALVEILAGLAETEQVVTQGALLIDAQAQLNREASGLDVPKATGPRGAADAPLPLRPPVAIQPAPLPPTTATTTATDPLFFLAQIALDAAGVLAADDFVAYQKTFPQLIAAGKLFPQLPTLALGGNLKEARRSFEPWSTAVADLLKPHKSTLGIKIFQCPMSPVLGKGRWLQRQQPAQNPFFGAAMANCGAELP